MLVRAVMGSFLSSEEMPAFEAGLREGTVGQKSAYF
jgi:hypothetical protein